MQFEESILTFKSQVSKSKSMYEAMVLARFLYCSNRTTILHILGARDVPAPEILACYITD